MRHEINTLAEFRDANREKEFHDHKVRRGLRLCRHIILIFPVVNLLFVLIDYFFLPYSHISVILFHSLIPRVLVLLCALLVAGFLKKAEDKSAAINSIVGFALLSYLMHIYTATHFAPVDVVFEVLDLVLLTYCLFLIPNRWITNLGAALLLCLTFFMTTPLTIPNLTANTSIPLVIYLFFQVLIVGILFYRIQIQERLNFLQQLQLEELAKTDVLTKVFNRIACDAALQQMCSSRCNFSLILVDIDDFKQINDTFGHLAGDEVIVRTVEAIKSIVRQDDLVARWGGEEFVIILPHTSLEGAAETASRIRAFLAKAQSRGTDCIITASFGVTAFIDGDNLNSIINRADQLLYKAKQQGKNRVISG